MLTLPEFISAVKEVITTRDPRAVYNSGRKSIEIEQNRPMARIMIQNALGWSVYIRRLKEGERKWPVNIILLKYEGLLPDSAKALATVWETLGVRMLNDKELSVVFRITEEI